MIGFLLMVVCAGLYEYRGWHWWAAALLWLVGTPILILIDVTVDNLWSKQAERGEQK